jgi:IS1 family transposase
MTLLVNVPSPKIYALGANFIQGICRTLESFDCRLQGRVLRRFRINQQSPSWPGLYYYTDKWGAYTRHLDPEQHTVSKRGTQKIERKHLTLRTRIKRLVRKTICFSKSTQMHDIVIGLFVNRYAFGRAV